MRRILLIARREYLAYARTVGFWLSLLALPLFGALGGGAVAMMERSGGEREIAIVDLSGSEAGPAVTQALSGARNEPGDRRRGRVAVVETPPELVAPADLAAAEAAARAAVDVEDSPFDSVVILTPGENGLSARVWSASATDQRVESAVRSALTQVNRARALVELGVDPTAVAAIDERRPEVNVFSPRSASGGEVGLRDRLPGVIGFILGMVLWSAIVTGASILLNSVMEEKANRVLEVLLASASPTEVLTGKVLGVAGVTLTVLAVWAGFGGAALTWLSQVSPEVTAAFSDALAGLLRGGLWLWLIGSCGGVYRLSAVLFAALGSFCETPRDAQTLIGPVMMALIVPIFVMQLAIRDPDLGAVRALSWVPFFTPFLMSARAPSGPPLIELVGTMAVMVVTCVIIVWLASKAFRSGALATGKLDWKGIVGLVRGGA